MCPPTYALGSNALTTGSRVGGREGSGGISLLHSGATGLADKAGHAEGEWATSWCEALVDFFAHGEFFANGVVAAEGHATDDTDSDGGGIFTGLVADITLHIYAPLHEFRDLLRKEFNEASGSPCVKGIQGDRNHHAAETILARKR